MLLGPTLVLVHWMLMGIFVYRGNLMWESTMNNFIVSINTEDVISSPGDYLVLLIHDLELEELINAGSNWIEKETNNKIKQDIYTNVLFDGNSSDFLLVPQTPLTAISSLYIDSERDFGTDTLVPSDEYGIRDNVGIALFEGRRFPRAKQSVKVSYTAGYATTPANLQLALKIWCQIFFHGHEKRDFGISSIDKQNDSYNRIPGVPKEVYELIEPYRNEYFPQSTPRRHY